MDRFTGNGNENGNNISGMGRNGKCHCFRKFPTSLSQSSGLLNILLFLHSNLDKSCNREMLSYKLRVAYVVIWRKFCASSVNCLHRSECLITSYLHRVRHFYFELGREGIVTGMGMGPGSGMGMKFEINENENGNGNYLAGFTAFLLNPTPRWTRVGLVH